ncbi:hypothetical protein DUZ99_16680 [Xylanibacillus composti]|uniref:Uncharacterized protein n=1 Tax=Xylanibacillus composti TaxID=1572762 RepID=A0A8J4H6N0_9BACL|nr:hypothetical protein [Xylanibacillus composti]MDT9726614.1 hypothetical protein [Xylanibacillus composti]GIQ70826.1 hypothetical protein XYCOK13_36500 [Xylanibacillus composti]
MARHTAKGKRFEGLIERADKALDNGYCIEASTIYYAILEERLISVLTKFGCTIDRWQKMHYCINKLKTLTATNSLARAAFDTSLLDTMDAWRDRRNEVIHDFAKMDIPYNDIEEWAKEGKSLLRQFNAAAMRLKKRIS